MRKIHNTDILNCIASLSSDEVFTPPKTARKILKCLPEEIWKDEKATFLDPCSKSGVFLREITKKLLDGLKNKIPKLEERLNHILKNQVFGISTTELTSLISRRSLYCSKRPDGKYSISQFENKEGNLKNLTKNHAWKNGKCIYCGVNERYKRSREFESYSYSFIHTNKPEELLNMKFDVIIGNPPYQISTGGSKAQAIPLYHKFIQQAWKLSPRYLAMIIPARWYSGGFGLQEFRKQMLSDRRVRKIVDFHDPNQCFPGIALKGGVCYFLWDRDNPGECEVVNNTEFSLKKMRRPLTEEGNNDSFIRFNSAVSIFRKINPVKEKFSSIVSSQKPFGIPTNYKINSKKTPDAVKIFGNKAEGYISRNEIPIKNKIMDSYKIFISAGYGAGEGFPHQIINKPFIGEPNSCCTETYVSIGPFSNKKECENALNYMCTKFFRFLVMILKNSQHALKKVYSLVPMQDFNQAWSDEKLYKTYGLNNDEILFIDKMIREMKK